MKQRFFNTCRHYNIHVLYKILTPFNVYKVNLFLISIQIELDLLSIIITDITNKYILSSCKKSVCCGILIYNSFQSIVVVIHSYKN